MLKSNLKFENRINEVQNEFLRFLVQYDHQKAYFYDGLVVLKKGFLLKGFLFLIGFRLQENMPKLLLLILYY